MSDQPIVANRYRCERKIASGGMATVWSAVDGQTGRRIAVKRLHPHLEDDPKAVARFRREVELARALDHPAILPVLDAGADDDGHFMVMPEVDGESLLDRLEREVALPWTEAQRIALAVASALEHAHSNRILHRDIKPANILIERSSSKVYLIDFGISSSFALHERLTKDGDAIGTVDYLAPERIIGSAGDPASDLYSLGVVLYEMVTGVRPFQGGSALAVALAHQAGSPTPPGDLVPIPETLNRVIIRSMAKEAQDRFRTVADFMGALWNAAAATQQVPMVSPYRRLSRLWGGAARLRRKLPAVAYRFAASVVSLTVGAIVF